MNVQQWLEETRVTETEIVRLLNNRFGDGVVYLSRNMPRRLYQLAMKKGLISEEGYITRKGRTLLAQFYAG